MADGRDDVARASEGMPLLIVDDVIALRAAAKSKIKDEQIEIEMK